MNQRVKDTEVALKMQSYAPGDLGKQYDLLNTQYRSLSDKSKDRQEKAAAEAQRKAAEAEKARQAAEKEAQQQAEKEAASQAPAPSQVGEWFQAPAGYKYLKVDSGKTYGQVKRPNNFQLITDAEAANYSPGHGNGWAKQ